jgi:fused signal recognition particle receptor
MLILADLGSTLTVEVIDTIEKNCSANQGATIETQVSSVLESILAPCNPPALTSAKPCTLLMIGINGAGKTTTCGKLAEKFTQSGKKVILAAGDTFRAAAIDQLVEWGKRTQCDVIKQQPGADSASVIFDAIESASAQGADYLIADTSGRLHTQQNLMAELAKVKKVMRKKSEDYPHETWLVLDASIGQNNIQQAQEFKNTIGVTGLIITKLDGSGKGGSIFSIAKQLQLPIHYIGMGERAADLIPFSSQDFVQSLFD